MFGFKCLAAFRCVKRNFQKIGRRLPNHCDQFVSATLMNAQHFFQPRAHVANHISQRIIEEGNDRCRKPLSRAVATFIGSQGLIEFAFQNVASLNPKLFRFGFEFLQSAQTIAG